MTTPLKKSMKVACLSLACSGFLSGAVVSAAETTAEPSTQTTTLQLNTAEGLMREAAALPLGLLLDKAQALKKQQAWLELLVLLYPQEVHHAGQPAFDSLLGLAASRTGELTRAILAYERVLDAEPQNTVIQAEMAALYFRTGENKDAQFLFQSLKAMPLPSEVARQLDQYLRALDERLRKPESGFKIWTSWATGHDSNINAGTELSTVKVPGYPDFEIPPDHVLRRRSSDMISGLLGLRWQHAFDDPSNRLHNCQLLTEGSAQVVDYARWSDFSTQSVALESALNCPRQDPRQQWQIGLQVQNEKRNHETVRNSQLVRGIYHWTMEGASQLTASVQTGRLQYPQDTLRDGHRHAASLGWLSKLGAQENWLLGTSVGLTQETVSHASRRHQGFGSVNWQGHARYSMTPTTALQLFVTHETRHHRGQDALFLSQRKDRQWLWVAALSWKPDSRLESQWTLSLSEQRNKSSLELYSFKRLTPTLNWRAAF